MKLRYSEKFYSLQGEGKYVGVPSVFLRTFGCNLRCQNFGLDRNREKERYNPEVKKLIDDGLLINTKTLEDLPIIHTGCDTYASIYPDFRNLMMNHTVDEVVDGMLELTPHGRWSLDNGQDIHLIITGGEPLLGWQKLYLELFEHPRMADLKHVTFETNGTQPLAEPFAEYLRNAHFHTTFSCSPKLSISGESWEDAIKPSAIQTYQMDNADTYLKFVVELEEDLEEVNKAVNEYRNAGIHCPVYLMPMGGRSEEYRLNVNQVADMALSNGYRYSPRLHVDLYGNEWGT